MSNGRVARIDELAELLAERALRTSESTLRVAVTGITASGKSTLATELVAGVQAKGTACFRVPVDGFHNPRTIRFRLGRESAEGYYRDAYNYELLVDRVLKPLGPGGDGRYVERVFDVAADVPVESVRLEAAPGSVGIFDASFLLRPEIRDHFDYRIFVQTSFEEAESRGVRRDSAALGGEDEARRLYRSRYHAAQKIYFREAEPLKHADVLFINDDPANPAVFFQRPERSS
jgi:uridine kinase